MKTKKFLIIAVILLVVCTAVGLVACGGTKQTVTVNGSSSVSPLMQKLAVEFEKLNKNTQIRITTSDSSTGITSAIEGKTEIGMISREIKSNEKGITATKIANDGLVIIANKSSAVTNVTSDQIYNLFANGAPIEDIIGAISREEGSGTRDAFDGLIKTTDGKKLSDLQSFASSVDIQNSTGNVMVDITSNATRLSYISLGSLNSTVKTLTFNGVSPSAENIKNATYKLARPFFIVTNDSKPKSEIAQRFIDFILNGAGQKVVTDCGYISI